tara:strand:+ start:12520 stop:12714 length:195 start_codon:yes stop_codon:yes gene_type:complete
MPTSLVCWFCGGTVIWGGDHTFEDYGWEGMGEGIVANLECKDCGATAYFITKPENEDEIPPVPL